MRLNKIFYLFLLPLLLFSCEKEDITIEEETILKETISISAETGPNSVTLKVSSSAIDIMKDVIIHWGTLENNLNNTIELENVYSPYVLTGVPEGDYYFKVTANYTNTEYNTDISIESEIVTCHVQNNTTSDIAISAERFYNCVTLNILGKDLNKIKDVEICYGLDETNLNNKIVLEDGVTEQTLFELPNGTYYFQAKATKYEIAYDGKEYNYDVSSDIISTELEKPKVNFYSTRSGLGPRSHGLEIDHISGLRIGRVLWGKSEQTINKELSWDPSITSYRLVMMYLKGSYYFKLENCYIKYKDHQIECSSDVVHISYDEDYKLMLGERTNWNTGYSSILYYYDKDDSIDEELYCGTTIDNLNYEVDYFMYDYNSTVNEFAWHVSSVTGETLYYQLKAKAEVNLDNIDYIVSNIIEIDFSKVSTKPEAIDLGLSVLWADRDLGAENYWQNGISTYWGDITGYSTPDFETYPPENISGTEHDIATAVLGDGWRLPTEEEIRELINNCTIEYEVIRNNSGILLTAANGNSIFLPTIEYSEYNKKYYWTGTLKISLNTPYFLSVSTSDYNPKARVGSHSHLNRYFIRPVKDNPNWNGGDNSGNGDATGKINGHDYVDLGLPSGLKWATCNVGASSPSDYGNYYAWGETTTKTEYTSSNCKTYNKNMGDISGNSSYDAARANWGSSWRMPTQTEFEELLNNCTWTWTSQDGHNGYKVKSKKNGNSIFLPAAGRRLGSSLDNAGDYGYYWSSAPDSSGAQRAYYLYFNSGSHLTNWYRRYYGRSVRAVSE